TRLKCIDQGDGKFVTFAEVLDVSEYCFAFANVFYDQYILSSTMHACIPSELGIENSNIKASRLVYDSSLGLDCFTVINTNELFHQNSELVMQGGALDMVGIRALMGDLATFKIGDPRYKGYEDDQLQIGYYSPI